MEAHQPRFVTRLFDGSLKGNVVLSVVLVAATVALYYPVHHHPFINFDDPPYITENPHIATGLDFGVVRWAFTHSYSHNWHPITWLSHALDIDLFDLDPAGHHDMNLVFHGLDVVLLFWVLQRATGYAGRSFMVAGLFALHPVNVESVAWVAERKNVLSMLFFLLALGAYRWFARKPDGGRYALVGLLYVLGLMAKPQVVTLPLVLLLWDYWPLQRMFASEATDRSPAVVPAMSLSQLVSEKVPLLFLAACSALVTIHAQHVAKDEPTFPVYIRLGNAIVSYARYLGQAVWPSRLALMYIHPGYNLKFYQVLISLLLLLAITVLVIRGRRHRYLPVGWFWFLGTLVPMIGLMQVSVQGMANRYAYQAYIGLFLMICWGVAELAERRKVPAVVLPAISVAVLLVLGAVAHRQLGYWRDNITLWSHALDVTDNNWVAELNLANGLREAGHPEQAIGHFKRSAEINPDFAATNLDIALYEQQHGNFAEAISYYQRVVKVWQDPQERVLALTEMAGVYRRLGDYRRAQECLEESRQPSVRR
jgi:hypothetical protein